MTAETISVSETLDLLRSSAIEVGDGVAGGSYVLWAGSGISRLRAPNLQDVVLRVLTYIQERADPANSANPYTQALYLELGLASSIVRASPTHVTTKPEDWPKIKKILRHLASKYSEVLDVIVPGQEADHLLWDGTDFRNTFATAQEPDTEHLCIAILIMEGAFKTIASANWDGLIEAAIERISSQPDDDLQVRILGSDFQNPTDAPTLLKFHGCAVAAGRDEATYRPLLVGRRRQITDWPTEDLHAAMSVELVKVASQSPTLMVGLSAQDDDIHSLFSQAKKLNPWVWPKTPPPHVFAEEELQSEQRALLAVVYGDHFNQIADEVTVGAVIPAYGKPLFMALTINVIHKKLNAFLNASQILSPTAATQAAELLGPLVSRYASQASTEYTSASADLSALSQFMNVFRTGRLQITPTPRYSRFSNGAVSKIATDESAKTNAMPELALLAALLEAGNRDGSWSTSMRNALSSGEVSVGKSGDAIRTFIFATEAAEIAFMESSGIDLSDPNTLTIRANYSGSSQPAFRRGIVRSDRRVASVSEAARGGDNFDEILQLFREGASL